MELSLTCPFPLCQFFEPGKIPPCVFDTARDFVPDELKNEFHPLQGWIEAHQQERIELRLECVCLDEEGEQIYPRKWNHDFIQLPMVRKDKQRRPAVTEADLAQILSNVKKRKYAVLFALLAGTGLRIGEALALRSTDFGPDCRLLHVRRSLWRGKEQEPKTPNVVRVVDIPEVLASELGDYISGVNGYLFATAQGESLQQRNVLRVLHSVKRVGFHAFRRFRLTWLRKSGAPKDLERFWMGHAPEEVADLYSKLKEDVAFRQEWAGRVGLGFELVHIGPQNAAAAEAEKVA